MDLNLIVESKSFVDDKEFHARIKQNPCSFCLFGQGMMCVERKYCRWDSHQEIYIKKEVQEIKE